MMKVRSSKQIRISNLLRMAELCSSDDVERKAIYMNELDKLMFEDGDVEKVNEIYVCEKKYNHLIDFFKEYKHMIHNHSSSDNYDLYVRYCLNLNIEPLAKLPFAKVMVAHFPIRSVNDHKGVGEMRKTYKKWLVCEEDEGDEY